MFNLNKKAIYQKITENRNVFSKSTSNIISVSYKSFCSSFLKFYEGLTKLLMCKNPKAQTVSNSC